MRKSKIHRRAVKSIETMLFEQDGRLVYRFDAEEVWIEPWGQNSSRVRATKTASMPAEDWALQRSRRRRRRYPSRRARCPQVAERSMLWVTKSGKLSVYNSAGTLLLEEYAR